MYLLQPKWTFYTPTESRTIVQQKNFFDFTKERKMYTSVFTPKMINNIPFSYKNLCIMFETFYLFKKPQYHESSENQSFMMNIHFQPEVL